MRGSTTSTPAGACSLSTTVPSISTTVSGRRLPTAVSTWGSSTTTWAMPLLSRSSTNATFASWRWWWTHPAMWTRSPSVSRRSAANVRSIPHLHPVDPRCAGEGSSRCHRTSPPTSSGPRSNCRSRGVTPCQRDDRTVKPRARPALAYFWRPSVGRVVDRSRVLATDGEAEAVNRLVAGRAQAVHLVRRDVDQVTGRDVARFAADRHDALAGHHEVELVRRVRVREHLAAHRHLELVCELEIAAVGEIEHLPRTDQPPDGNRSVVLDLGLDITDVAHVHSGDATAAPVRRVYA